MKKIFIPIITGILFCMVAILFSKGHASPQTEKTIPLDPSVYPEMVTIDSLHNRAYISSHTSVATIPMPITVLDTLHDTVVGVIPSNTLRAVGINGTTHLLYVGDANTNLLTVYSTDTLQPVSTISSSVTAPVTMAVNETANRIYVIGSNSTGTTQKGVLSVLDGEKGANIANAIPVGNDPRAVAVNPISNKIYVVAASNDPGLTVIDGSTNTVAASIPVTTGLTDVAVDTILDRVFVTSDTGNSVYVIDGKNDAILTQIPIVNSISCAHTLAVDQIAHRLFATCFNGLTVIDTKTNTILQQLPLTGQLPITRSITAQYFSLDYITNKIYIPLEETHQIAVVSQNNAPKLDPILPVKGLEGDASTIAVSFTDTDSSSWTAAVDYGDNTPLQTQLVTATAFSLQHIYNTPGTFTVKVTLTDAEGTAGFVTGSVTIQNVSPTVGAISASDTLLSVNTPLHVKAAFTDPGKNDSHTAVWNFGDGIVADASISAYDRSGFAEGTHSYSLPGVYGISVTVIDRDGAATTNKLEYVTVYDTAKNSGAVGVGTFTVPVGAYSALPTVMGKGSFGFFVKNTAGFPPATGSAQIALQVANVTIQSTAIASIAFLPVGVQLKGIGMLNHTGSVSFSLLFQDNIRQNSPNTLRMKIWDTGTGKVIFDTQMNDPDLVAPKTVIESGTLILTP